jgi:large subunit ribosomal protein L10
LNKQNKKKTIELYRGLFQKYEAILLLSNKGLIASDFSKIRIETKRSCVDNKLLVIKNSLAKIAIQDTKFSKLSPSFSGSNFIIYTNDLVSSIKMLVGLLDQVNFSIAAAHWHEDRVLTNDDIIMLSKLPSREEINIKIIRLLQSIPRKLATLMNRPGTNLVQCISAFSRESR